MPRGKQSTAQAKLKRQRERAEKEIAERRREQEAERKAAEKRRKARLSLK